MYRRMFLCLIVFNAMSTHAQTPVETINVHGNVMNNGTPVAGAEVTLLGQNLEAVTNANGEYAITRNYAAVLRPKEHRVDKIVFKKCVLELTLSNASPVRIEVFDVKGTLIENEIRKNAATGVYRMNIAENYQASKLLIIQASVGGNTMTYRYLPLSNGNFGTSSVPRSMTLSTGSRLSKLTAAIDSIEVKKSGFKAKVVTIQSYDVTVDISLDSAGKISDFVEDDGYDCQTAVSSGSNGGSSSVLPDPFSMWDGTQVKTMEDWRCRRRELLVEAEKLILGEKAPPPSKIGGKVSGSITNSKYIVNVDNPDGSTSFSGSVNLPSSGSAPYPAIIVVNIPGFGTHSLSPEVLASEGVAYLMYNPYDISSEGKGDFTTGKYFDANPDYKGKTGALVAWGWGVSRIIDMLELHPEVIDPTKIAVHGCSRFGKGAFVIGAFDQRIALGLPFESGTGGPPPLRALPTLGGQSLVSCNNEASWFGPMSKDYSATMPVDMSDVVALYAPRGLLMMDNPHNTHLSYKANYLGCAAAREIYKAMGKEEALWYLGNTNNSSHCANRQEYADAQRAMIRKFLKGDNHTTTGGLDKHTNHGNIDVERWTSTWNKGTISE